MTPLVLLIICLAAVVLPIRRATIRVEHQLLIDRLMHVYGRRA